MKKILAVLLTIVLASCTGNTGEDLKQTRDDKEFSVVLNIVPDKDIIGVCAQLGVQYEANGCNSFNSGTKVCTIYVMAPKYVSDEKKLSIIGHELWHCRYGAFHD